ncbi:MAG: glutamate 5-kinase [Thermoleophilia bacterium]
MGSNTLTDVQGCLRDDTLTGLVAEIAALAKGGDKVLLVSSGAISCGLGLIPIAGRPTETVELQAASAIGQGRLFHRYYRLFADLGVTAAQVLLTSFDIEARSQYLNARNTLLKLLEWGIVPIVNENDTTSADEIRYGDNDFLAAQAAILVKADLLMLLTDTEGLYTSDPSEDSGAQLVEEVRDWSELERIEVGGTGSPIGSGGMKSKIVAAQMATTANIETVIANGSRPGVVTAIAAGEKVGTRFHPLKSSMSSFKLWLRYGRPSSGALVVDEGAANALRKRGKSLLPAGITRVEGHFAAGEAVDVFFRKDGRRLIGKGITNFSADELRRIKGMQSQQVMKLLPHGEEEVIHRDYFVLAD